MAYAGPQSFTSDLARQIVVGAVKSIVSMDLETVISCAEIDSGRARVCTKDIYLHGFSRMVRLPRGYATTSICRSALACGAKDTGPDAAS